MTPSNSGLKLTHSFLLPCYIMAITCAIFCFLPAIMGMNIDLSLFDGKIASAPLWNALLSSRYHICLVICIGSSLPVLFDLTIDLFLIHTSKYDTARFAVWLMFLSLVIPNIVTYFYVIPGEHIEIFPSVIKSRLFLLLASNMIIIHGYGSAIWRLKYTLVIVAIYGIGFTVVLVMLNSRIIRERTIYAHAQHVAETTRRLVEDVQKVQLRNIVELQDCCNSVVDVLNDLLAYECIEDRTVELDSVQIPLKSFLEEKKEMLSVQSEPNGIHLTMSFDDDERRSEDIANAVIWGDIHKIGQVFRVLLSNAVDVTPRGGAVEITVDLHSRPPHIVRKRRRRRDSMMMMMSKEEEQTYVRVRIRDFGPGLSKSDVSHVFQHGIHFTAGTLQDNQKRGLGLWIAHRVVELHEGTLSVHSDGEGTGCVFTLELPCVVSGKTMTPITRHHHHRDHDHNHHVIVSGMSPSPLLRTQQILFNVVSGSVDPCRRDQCKICPVQVCSFKDSESRLNDQLKVHPTEVFPSNGQSVKAVVATASRYGSVSNTATRSEQRMVRRLTDSLEIETEP
eukprot:gene8724-18037_t